MRVDWIRVRDFKNLDDVEFDFDEDSPYTVLLGQNGTGKSNLIEALVIIFRDLDLGEVSSFPYQLRYVCRNHRISVDSDPNRERDKIKILVDDRAMSLPKFAKRSERQYLPSYLFGYYSGPSNRLEQHFEKHQSNFYQELLKAKPNDEIQPLRPLFYARLIHSQFVLLSYFLDLDSADSREFLQDFLGIVDLESVLFVMKRPPWVRNNDDLFWGARGTVRTFLERLYGIALAPMRLPRNGKDQPFFLYVKDLAALLELFKSYQSQGDFFKSLESTYISKLISEVRIRVKLASSPDDLTFAELSEGEQQLLTVLGLLKFTHDSESLFLLDEPDTHLNPGWGIRYFDLIRDVIGDSGSSNIIVSTHDPLMVAGLTRNQVMLLHRDEGGSIVAKRPNEDPRGLGVAGLLTSEMFGLRSTLDSYTLDLLDRKRELAVADELSHDDLKQLDELNDKLAKLGFVSSHRDPLFESFEKVMTESEEYGQLRKTVLTPEEVRQQQELARKVLKQLAPTEGSRDPH
jgi:predicted ATPase